MGGRRVAEARAGDDLASRSRGPTAAPDAPVPGNPDFKADQPQLPGTAGAAASAAGGVGRASAQELLAYIQQIGVEGLEPRRLRSGRTRDGDRDRQPGDHLSASRPSASTWFRPTSRSAM